MAAVQETSGPKMHWLRLPPQIYYNRGVVREAFEDLSAEGLRRAIIVTDNEIRNQHFLEAMLDNLGRHNIDYDIFTDVRPDCDAQAVEAGLKRTAHYKPDTIIAVGGGSCIDTAKVIRALYENDLTDVKSLISRFEDLHKQGRKPLLRQKKIKKLVAIPTTSGTGAEMTPFANLTDKRTYERYSLVNVGLTPEYVVVDPDFAMTMPPQVAAFSGFNALTHAIESYTSKMSNDFTKGLSSRATGLLLQHLGMAARPQGYDASEGANAGQFGKSREEMHHAASIAGMAFASAFGGLASGIAHQLRISLRVPQGLASAMALRQVLHYNAQSENGKKILQELVEEARCPGIHTIDDLINRLQDIKKQTKTPLSLREFGIPEDVFKSKLHEMASLACADHATLLNVRQPTPEDVRQILMDAYEGKVGGK
eukprot:GDKI01007898.1.p1 GENE.GDKI01007898.1~~GDKI01007898.1.p1  ORF type:complete len:432 (-),score=155.74 GDKI01007898.1:25-1296(-)